MVDFSVTNKSFMTVKLTKNHKTFLNLIKTKEETEILHILPPKRKLYAMMTNIETQQNNNDDVEKLYSIATEILNNNSNKKTFTTNDIDKMLTVLDITNLITNYAKFVNNVVNSPN